MKQRFLALSKENYDRAKEKKYDPTPGISYIQNTGLRYLWYGLARKSPKRQVQVPAKRIRLQKSPKISLLASYVVSSATLIHPTLELAVTRLS